MMKETRVTCIKVDVLSGVKILYGYSYNNQISWWITSITQISNFNLRKGMCQHNYTTDQRHETHDFDEDISWRATATGR